MPYAIPSTRARSTGFPMEDFMYDLLYVIGTFVFFALMLAYIAGCA